METNNTEEPTSRKRTGEDGRRLGASMDVAALAVDKFVKMN